MRSFKPYNVEVISKTADYTVTFRISAESKTDAKRYALAMLSKPDAWIAISAARTPNLEDYSDGEIVGVDTDGCLILWDDAKSEKYNSGHTLKQFGGMKNLTNREKARVKRK